MWVNKCIYSLKSSQIDPTLRNHLPKGGQLIYRFSEVSGGKDSDLLVIIQRDTFGCLSNKYNVYYLLIVRAITINISDHDSVWRKREYKLNLLKSGLQNKAILAHLKHPSSRNNHQNLNGFLLAPESAQTWLMKHMKSIT